MKRKPNVLVIGAAGGVANAFFLSLFRYRHLIASLHLADKHACSPARTKNYDGLRYKFHKMDLKLPKGESAYQNFLKKWKINLVIDLTTLDTLPILEATDRAGVTYINTALNSKTRHSPNLVREVLDRSKDLAGAPHIVCAGMNPGAVNAFVRYGIQKHGLPKQIVHFEFDSSEDAAGWQKPLITWSREIFLNEICGEPGGMALNNSHIREIRPNALAHPFDMKSILEPIIELDRYPLGAQVLHEENLTLANQFNIPSQFLYAVHPMTMDVLFGNAKRKRTPNVSSLVLGDNVVVPLKGSDMIGVMLEYPGRRVYYVNTLSNDGLTDTNATYKQVALGLISALQCLLHDPIPPGVHFTGDLYDLGFGTHVFKKLRVEESVFKKSGKAWKRISYNPRIRAQH